MKELAALYKNLINVQLPAAYTFPVHYNHCFNRIILDWLFNDCWYNHLDKKRTAICQLTEQQFSSAIERMNTWLQNQDVLIADNNASLRFRKKMQ